MTMEMEHQFVPIAHGQSKPVKVNPHGQLVMTGQVVVPPSKKKA